jgi:predicted acetyltransferase
MAIVHLESINPNRRPALEAMFQLYIHDFSEFWSGQGRGELLDSGQFESDPRFDRCWTEPGRSAWFIRANGHLAGFALLSSLSHSGQATDFDMAEFFVVRKHRRSGVGFQAARQLIGARAGQWEIAVVRANVGALAFWRRVAAEVAPQVDEQHLDDDRWSGAVLRFNVAG